jgi:hypothetical protein
MSTDHGADAADGPATLTENSLEMVAMRRLIYSLAGYPPGEEHPDGYDIIDAVDDAVERIGALDGAGAGGDVPDDVQERLVALESTVDTDLDGKAYEELTRKDKVREIQTALINEAASSPTNKTAMDYQEIRWLFNARPSTGHVYDLMDFAGQENGFDYQHRDGGNNRLTVDLDDVNEELRVHAANNRDG